jgi:predicted GIY-YIG superfamily endonuclease
METRSFYVYILASRIGGTLYIGVTNDLVRRVAEHKSKIAHQASRYCPACLFRIFRRHRTGNSSRKAAEKVDPSVEDPIN